MSKYKFVNPADFDKTNKTKFSEYHVRTFFVNNGFKTFVPLSDTGLDLIAIKNDIKLFIQIKTRRLNNELNFGFTLKDKDMTTDPRKIFVFYEDNLDDFIFFTIRDFFELFSGSYISSIFESDSFRVGNNKNNSIRYWNENKKYTLGTKNRLDLSPYINNIGIKRIEDYYKTLSIRDEIETLRKYKIKKMYDISSKKLSKPYKKVYWSIAEKNSKINTPLKEAENSYYRKEKEWK